MTGMKSIVVPDGSLILDTDTKLSVAVLQEVAAYRDAEGRAVFGIERYVSLGTIDLAFDIDPLEAARIVDAVPAFGLIQHCPAPTPPNKTWIASVARGGAQGVVAAKHANIVGYPVDSHLGYDNEDCSGDVEGDVDAWVGTSQPWPTVLYTGYAPGLTEQQLWELANVHLYWGAAGMWDVAVCSVALRQHYPPITIGGVSFDWNIASADKKGRRLRLATAA